MSTLKVDEQEEKDLVNSATKGDLDAFNKLVIMHQDLAFNLANSMLGDSFLAEDATQESFIKAFQNIDKFRGGSFRAWLLRILNNTVYDMLRKSRRHPTQPLFIEDENGKEIESFSWLADPQASVQEVVEQQEFSDTLFRMLDELPEVYRSVLTLIDIHELNYTEVAQSLNIPIGTVKSRLVRARLKIGEKLHKANIYCYSDIHGCKKLTK